MRRRTHSRRDCGVESGDRDQRRSLSPRSRATLAARGAQAKDQVCRVNRRAFGEGDEQREVRRRDGASRLDHAERSSQHAQHLRLRASREAYLNPSTDYADKRQNLRNLWLRWFSALWSIEQNPQRQITGEVFKPMFDPGRGEENIGWSKRLPALAADVFTRARRDKINFVARVWLLRIDAARRIDLDEQTPVLEHSCKALAWRSGQTFERFGNSRGDTRVV